MFRLEICRLGWPEQSLRIDERWASDDMERVRAYATELINLEPDAIFVGGGRALSVLRLRRSRALRVTALLVTETVTRHGRGGSRLFYELSFWLVAHWYTGARCTACAARENGWSVNKPKNIKW